MADSNGQIPPQEENKLVGEEVNHDQVVELTTSEPEKGKEIIADEELEEVEVELDPTAEEQKKKKKKKNKKPGKKRGLGKPTGFEEYNADGPLTVEEHKQDNDLYSLDNPFVVRIMTAIQRYEARRKMSNEQRDVFYKYLAYGGVDVGPNMFQGLDPTDRKELDKEDLVTVLAQTSISEEKHNIGEEGSPWVIDFKRVVEGFISRRAPELYEMPTLESVKAITNVLSNFMTYLLLHNVCPEFANDILTTRSFLDKDGPRELWNMKQAQRWMPGDFNIACSTLFGGFYAQNFGGPIDWTHESDTNQPDGVVVGMADEEARNVAKFAIAAAASEAQTYTWVEYANENIVAIDSVIEGAFEITMVYPITSETKTFYKEESPGYRPVGRILARKWTVPNSRDEDLTDEEKKAAECQTLENQSPSTLTVYSPERDYDYEFFLEVQILQYCVPGMKVEATIYKLNCGIMFFDSVSRVYCSFDRLLANELMLGYTKPRAVGVKAEEEAARTAQLDEARRLAIEAEMEEMMEHLEGSKEDSSNNHEGKVLEDTETAGQPGQGSGNLSDVKDADVNGNAMGGENVEEASEWVL